MFNSNSLSGAVCKNKEKKEIIEPEKYREINVLLIKIDGFVELER